MKKGFTLVELIGVIVILALVALIAIPSISNVLSTNKKELCATQMENILLAAQSWASNNKDILPSNDGDTKTITLNDLIKGGFIEEPTNALTKEPFDKNIKIIITRVGQKYEYEFETNYKISNICKIVSKTEKNINHNIKINVEQVTATTNNMVISFNVTGLPDKVVCRYTNKKGKYDNEGTISDNKCTLNNLKANTKYYYELCAVNEDGNDIVCNEQIENTKKIESISMVSSNVPINIIGGYVRSQNVNVTYNPSNISKPSYYIRSTKIGKSNISVNSICGNGNLPSNCTSISASKNLSSGYWYKVNQKNITVSYTDENLNSNKLYALIYDGVNYSDMASIDLAKVDTTRPNITLKQQEAKTTSISINYDISDSSGIGSYICEYGVDVNYISSDSSTDSSIKYKEATNYNSTSCTITGLSANTMYHYRICAKDKVGNPTSGIANNCKEGTITTAEVITSPTLSSSSSGYASITANYTAGSATSGIKETNCYLTDQSGNIIANGSLSGNSCIFNVTATEENTTYYFKKCITSNRGNTACSEVSSTENMGYCAPGNYTTNESCFNYSICSDPCGGTRTGDKMIKYISKYNGSECYRKTEIIVSGCTESCGGLGDYKYETGGKSAKINCNVRKVSDNSIVESYTVYKHSVTCSLYSKDGAYSCKLCAKMYEKIYNDSTTTPKVCANNYGSASDYIKDKHPKYNDSSKYKIACAEKETYVVQTCISNIN